MPPCHADVMVQAHGAPKARGPPASADVGLSPPTPSAVALLVWALVLPIKVGIVSDPHPSLDPHYSPFFHKLTAPCYLLSISRSCCRSFWCRRGWTMRRAPRELAGTAVSSPLRPPPPDFFCFVKPKAMPVDKEGDGTGNGVLRMFQSSE